MKKWKNDKKELAKFGRKQARKNKEVQRRFFQHVSN
jgi:hypothetical protein